MSAYRDKTGMYYRTFVSISCMWWVAGLQFTASSTF